MPVYQASGHSVSTFIFLQATSQYPAVYRWVVPPALSPGPGLKARVIFWAIANRGVTKKSPVYLRPNFVKTVFPNYTKWSSKFTLLRGVSSCLSWYKVHQFWGFRCLLAFYQWPLLEDFLLSPYKKRWTLEFPWPHGYWQLEPLLFTEETGIYN